MPVIAVKWWGAGLLRGAAAHNIHKLCWLRLLAQHIVRVAAIRTNLGLDDKSRESATGVILSHAN